MSWGTLSGSDGEASAQRPPERPRRCPRPRLGKVSGEMCSGGSATQTLPGRGTPARRAGGAPVWRGTPGRRPSNPAPSPAPRSSITARERGAAAPGDSSLGNYLCR